MGEYKARQTQRARLAATGDELAAAERELNDRDLFKTTLVISGALVVAGTSERRCFAWAVVHASSGQREVLLRPGQ